MLLATGMQDHNWEFQIPLYTVFFFTGTGTGMLVPFIRRIRNSLSDHEHVSLLYLSCFERPRLRTASETGFASDPGPSLLDDGGW